MLKPGYSGGSVRDLERWAWLSTYMLRVSPFPLYHILASWFMSLWEWELYSVLASILLLPYCFLHNSITLQAQLLRAMEGQKAYCN